MSWLEAHKLSEEMAAQAHHARRAGDSESAKELFAGAAEFEQLALSEIDAEQKPKTYGVTAVSAVALLYKAEALHKAELLAHSLLANPSMPEFGVDQLRELLQSIWNEQAQAAAGIKFAPAQVTVSVDGGEVVKGGAPLDLVVERVQTVQAMFYRTAEFLKQFPLRRRGPATKPILDVCRPWLFQSVPGSYQFTVAIQGDSQMDFLHDRVLTPDLVASTFMAILQSAATDPEHALLELVADKEYQQAFLKLTRNLAPSGRSFTQMEVRSSRVGESVLLTQESRKAITRTIRGRDVPSSPLLTNATLFGVLRAVHLDQDWLDVLVNGVAFHVKGLGEALDDVIGPMVNHNVTVQVATDEKGAHHFRDIELDEGE